MRFIGRFKIEYMMQKSKEMRKDHRHLEVGARHPTYVCWI